MACLRVGLSSCEVLSTQDSSELFRRRMIYKQRRILAFRFGKSPELRGLTITRKMVMLPQMGISPGKKKNKKKKHCGESLSKTLYLLLGTGSTQGQVSWHV